MLACCVGLMQCYHFNAALPLNGCQWESDGINGLTPWWRLLFVLFLWTFSMLNANNHIKTRSKTRDLSHALLIVDASRLFSNLQL